VGIGAVAVAACRVSVETGAVRAAVGERTTSVDVWIDAFA